MKHAFVLVTLTLFALPLDFYSQKEIQIGRQIWMSENLNVNVFRNGDIIPEAKTNSEWETAAGKKQPAWCYYDNDPANGAKYGKIYNWYAVTDPRGLAPSGYHVPSERELFFLSAALDSIYGEEKSGPKMKSTSGWKECSGSRMNYRTNQNEKYINPGNGDNQSGFDARPGGARGYSKGNTYNPGTSVAFQSLGEEARWWSSTRMNEPGVNYARYYSTSICQKGNFGGNNIDAGNGCYVRCKKNK